MQKFFRHYFFPHESNNHRAKVLHHSSLLVLIISVIGLSFLFSFTAKHDESVLGISYSVTPDELLILTNQKRQEIGLSALTMNNELADAARRKASDMFSKNYWAHIAPDGTTPWYFIKSAGYEYVYAGENLARGFYSSSDVINAWMASPSHRENMLSPNYQDIGFAIQEGNLTGDDTVLVVEELGNRTRATTQAKQEQVLTPTPAEVIQEVSPISAPVEIITPTPTPVPVVAVITPIGRQSTSESQLQVAAFKNDPLVNKPVAQKNIAAFILVAILILLIVDIIIIRRKHIVRILSHNLDHIIFFSVLLLIILLLTRGGVL